MDSGNDKAASSVKGAVDEGASSATVTDSPAANRRERRESDLYSPPVLTPLIERRNRESNVEQALQTQSTGTAVDSHSSSQDRPVVHRDAATRLHASRLVLFGADIGLMRTFCGLIGVLCLLITLTVPFLSGNAALRSIFWGGSFLSVFTSFWLYATLRDKRRYNQRHINTAAAASLLVVYSGVLYLGVHSPAALAVLPGLYFVGRSQKSTTAYAMYLICALIQALLSGLILAQVVPDPGLITAAAADFQVRIVAQGLVQILYFITFMLSRRSRFFTLEAMNKAVTAEAKAQEREAAFIEVREDLDRVLGAGGVGHYTDQVLGGYKLSGIIGRGAMGEVYDAVHVATAQVAAAKVLHPHVLAKKSSVQRFLREAEAASAMRTEHAVQIFSASEPGDPLPFLIMEKLRGHDLAHHLRERGRLPLGDLVTLVQQVGSVIDMAAKQGIVHRDLKPQNLFLAESPQGAIWKVLDFGASKLEEHSGTLTQGRVIGTPSYMSPQQAKGQDVDGAADRYGLAAIVYRSLTGRPPFAGKDLPTTLFHVVYGTPPQPSVVAQVDPAVDLVLAIGMSKAPEKRFASAKEFANALESASAGRISNALKLRAKELLRENPWGMLPDQAED